MDLKSIVTALGPPLISYLQNMATGLKTPAPPVIAEPLAAAADQAIKDLQACLNVALRLNPPLMVDGWLGPKTDAAIEQAIAMLKSYGIG